MLGTTRHRERDTENAAQRTRHRERGTENAAQRMYVARGYIPDGKRVHYDDEPMRKYVEVMLDDSLLLYLTKKASA